MTITFILDEEHNVIPCKDVEKWTHWFANPANRRVAEAMVGRMYVSTVFLAIWSIGGVFETAVFNAAEGYGPRIVERYDTWAEAEAGHRRWVQAATRELNG